MGRGQRCGALTKSILVERIKKRFPNAEIKENTSLVQLLGHAIYHQLVSDHEAEESTPRNKITTIPCYLFTYVRDATVRSQIEKYVVTTSKLFRRGSILLNLIAQQRCGLRHPGASDSSVPVLRPRFRSDDLTDETMNRMRSFVSMLEPPPGQHITANTLKHVFLPERWPSREVELNPDVANILLSETFRHVLPPCPSDWLELMSRYVSGWDNCINRMMTKYCGNIKVHATANIIKAVESYLWAAPIESDWDLMKSIVLRPTILCPAPVEGVSDADYDLAMDLRRCIMGDRCTIPFTPSSGQYSGQEITKFTHCYIDKDNIEYSSSLMLLHLFLARYGVLDRSYLPVASRGRKYAYVDTKVANFLFRKASDAQPTNKGSPLPEEGKNTISDDTEDAVLNTKSVGEVMGITPHDFNVKRKEIRRQVRRRKRRNASRRLTRKERDKAIRERNRWKRIGTSKMPTGARIDSIETDGVGLRMVIKMKDNIQEYIIPIGSSPPKKPKTNVAKKKSKKNASEPDPPHPLSLKEATKDHAPIFISDDPGRAKLIAAAILQERDEAPQVTTFTRRRHYHEMGHSARTKWENNIVAENTQLQTANIGLSVSGGLHNCDTDKWIAYLAAETTHRSLLDAEYVEKIDRAKWTMKLFRSKRQSLDNAVNRLFAKALIRNGRQLPVTRPLVLGFGSADFSSCGFRGELPAPTAQLSRAMTRKIECIKKTGRQVLIYGIDEFRTTMCCCGCGAVTRPPDVTRRKKNKETGMVDVTHGPSRRLRQCTSCVPDGKLRDRDSQAARNILLVTIAMFYGNPRPEHLRRGG